MNIEDLKKKIKKATNNKKTDFQNRGNAFGMAMRLGTEFVAAVFVASFIGFYIDKWLETTPIFIIIFFIIGSVAGIFNVVRSSKMINKE